MFDHEYTMSLIAKSHEGDNDARAALVEDNMPLIKSIVRRFKRNTVEYDDLIQLGTLGLIKAINNFKNDFNVKFSTYAVPMIAGEIKRYLRDDGIIKVSRAIKGLNAKIIQYVEEIKSSKGVEPTIAEIALKFNIPETDVVFAMDSAKFPVSLHEKSGDDEGLELIDRISSKENTDDNIDKMVLRDSILMLPERERKIIILRYFRDKTQSEIAKQFGVSQVQISRIESKIIKKLRESLA